MKPTARTEVQSSEVDQQLVRRVQQGDKSAFDLLVAKYQGRIGKLVGRFISDHAEVQDITQETFIKAYRALGNFRGDSAFYTWLYRIAINTAKNALVARRRRPPTNDVDVTLGASDGGVELVDSATPEGDLAADELRSVIQQTLDELPQELRTALVLCEFEGLSYEEIAEAMECPVGTVRSRIFRARKALEKQMQDHLNPVSLQKEAT